MLLLLSFSLFAPAVTVTVSYAHVAASFAVSAAAVVLAIAKTVVGAQGRGDETG